VPVGTPFLVRNRQADIRIYYPAMPDEL
jgi:hypothetical protein